MLKESIPLPFLRFAFFSSRSLQEHKNENQKRERIAYLEKTTNPLHITNTKNTDTIIEYMLQMSDLIPSLIQCILCPVAISTGVGSGNGTKTSYKFPN